MIVLPSPPPEASGEGGKGRIAIQIYLYQSIIRISKKFLKTFYRYHEVDNGKNLP
jgi:hypothetical protein